MKSRLPQPKHIGFRRMPIALVAVSAVALMLGSVNAPALGATAASSTEVRPFEPADGEGPDITAPKSNAPSHVPAVNVPRVNGLPIAADPTSKLIEGLSLKDQRDSNGGNSFSLEPPDQALCVGATEVIEGVNNVFATYSRAGTRTSGPQSYSPFWSGLSEIDRTKTPPVYGPFFSDPKCYYDPELGRFFMTELQLGTNPTTGAFTGDSFVDVAVSKSGTPSVSSSDWYMYKLNVRNDGTQGTPSHAGCPCLGDQPLIGADRFGFFVSTNEFPIAGTGFNGAQIYAFDKAALATGTMKVQRIESPNTPLAEGTAYSVQPATSPSAADWSNSANGTEYALSALEFTGGYDNRIATWAFTNTASLRTASPQVKVSKVVIGSEVYGMPPKARQKAGSLPLGSTLKAKENLLDTNDDRMQQTVYAGGKLWSGLNTAVKTNNGPTRTGIAYIVVSPAVQADAVAATMSYQSYVAVNRDYLFYPSIGVAPGGTKAAVVFSLSGDDYYPSTAFVRLAGTGRVASAVRLSAAGKRAADGFTGYPAYGGNGVERWGDYSVAVGDEGGTIWMAAEYIPGTFGYPPYLANWGTAVSTTR